MRDLQLLFDRKDFEEMWVHIAADIKVRKYAKLKDIPEFKQMPSKIQETVEYSHKSGEFNYDTFHDEGCLYSTAYVILIAPGTENWIGMFRYNYARTAGKILGTLCGFGVLIGGIYYFFNAAPQHVASLVGYIAKNYQTIQDDIVTYAGSLLTGAAFYTFRQWLMNDYSPFNMFIAACILKKLDGIRMLRIL